MEKEYQPQIQKAAIKAAFFEFYIWFNLRNVLRQGIVSSCYLRQQIHEKNGNNDLEEIHFGS